MTLHPRFEAMTDRTWCRPDHARTASQFSANWLTTLTDLEVELEHLDASDLTFELAVDVTQLRRDRTGLLKHVDPPAPVIVSFDTADRGRLVFRADTFEIRSSGTGMSAWRHNVRAVALTLNSMRSQERYGASAGAQYDGFKALNAGSGAPASHMTAREAEEVLGHWTGEDAWLTADNPTIYRQARARAHPDRNGGDRTGWDRVEQAGRVLGVSR